MGYTLAISILGKHAGELVVIGATVHSRLY